MLSETKLATLIEPRILSRLEWLGARRDFAPGELVLAAGTPSDSLVVLLGGQVVIEHEDRPRMAGAGEILGELGFILGGPRSRNVRAGSGGCSAWTLARSLLDRPSSAERQLLLTHLIIAMSPYQRIRWLMLSKPRTRDPGLLANHCDHDHPAIIEMARQLVGGDPWETTARIWRYVRALPYRFGFWSLRASETLALGFGMCTTKANLQVALLRAAGLEAHFAETRLDSQFVKPLLPSGYRAFIGRDIKHYFAVVRLDGQLHACDASFTRGSLQLLAREVPELHALIQLEFGRDRPRIPMIDGEEGQPPPYRLLEDLAAVMAKEPFYDEDNAEAMNVVLDRTQGSVQQFPAWVGQARACMDVDPEQAFLRAIAGFASDCARLRDTLAATAAARPHG